MRVAIVRRAKNDRSEYFICILSLPIVKRDNCNVHRDAGESIASKNRGAGGSECNVLLSDGFAIGLMLEACSALAHAVSAVDILFEKEA